MPKALTTRAVTTRSPGSRLTGRLSVPPTSDAMSKSSAECSLSPSLRYANETAPNSARTASAASRNASASRNGHALGGNVGTRGPARRSRRLARTLFRIERRRQGSAPSEENLESAFDRAALAEQPNRDVQVDVGTPAQCAGCAQRVAGGRELLEPPTSHNGPRRTRSG